MKHGRSNDFDSEFKYWVLPDKPMGAMQYGSNTVSNLRGGWQDVDGWKLKEQAERYREVLGRSCKGKWMETNSRYFFEQEEDYEMFLVMCALTTQS